MSLQKNIEKTCSRKRACAAVNVDNNVPDDVLWNIFIRLPAKQVAQMRCVSKPWNTLLSQQSFTKSHLDHRSIRRMNDDEILLVFKDGYFDFCHPFLTHPSRSSIIQLPKLPNSTPSCGSSIFIGSVNGLICFADYQVIHIWNLSLSALTPLPSYTNTTIGDELLFRFGFDPLNDDYKVVKISLSLDEHGNIVEGSLEVEVFSLRKGFWELVIGFPSHVSMICNNDEVCVDGHAYWLCLVEDMFMPETIVAFDLAHETFREISFPNSMKDYKESNRLNVLGVLSQKLCVISCIHNGDCEVWLRMDHKWVKHLVFPPFDGKIMPIGFTPNNLFLFGIGRHLALYDPDAAAVKLFIGIMNTPNSFTKVVPYVDSLIWPPTLRAINH
ncbi:F-box domain-containing protein [Artemisia annua]|uniref:F-box domain-containing protein n=1 Tax=Artemisia annua TaxID=35608 RepID=A0A2U1MS75_ARTAN|nr:F-box domain-containing protein [Artemisia annua]